MLQGFGHINKEDFFREITVRICSSLDIAKALHRCFLFLNDIMPVDKLVLLTYEGQIGILNIEAVADYENGYSKDIKIPLLPVLQDELETAWDLSRVRYMKDISKDPFISTIADILDFTDLQAIVTRFIIEGRYIGAFVVVLKTHIQDATEYLELLESINEPVAIALNNCKQFKEISMLKNLLAEERRYLQHELNERVKVEVIGADFGLRKVMERVNKVAPLISPVLIYGETGTGKEIISQIIHDLSPRSDGPFIKLNCGAIPDTLIDSELFGHEKGAFTGAISQKKGRFERADKGTIFLDEISELPPNAQVRLLRVLQEKEIERVGGTHTIKVDVRIISATNRNLDELVYKGKFREDLYFRLNVFPIYIPPLRERKGDIPALVQHFIMKKFKEMALPKIPVIERRAMEILLDYDWPGNVRELENVVERAIILSKGRPIDFRDIIKIEHTKDQPSEVENYPFPTLKEIEKEHIKKALEMCSGKVEGKDGAAHLLGINPGTLRHTMKKLHIPFGRKAKYDP